LYIKSITKRDLYLCYRYNLLRTLINIDVIDSDDVISEGSIEFSTVGAPGQSSTRVVIRSVLGGFFLLGFLNDELGNWVIGITVQVEDMNTVFTSSSNPLLNRVEGNLADGGTSVEDSVFFIQVIEVPDLEDIFLTTSGNVGTQRSNGEGVNVFLVSLQGVLDQEVGLPDLESTVPTNSGEVGVLGNWGVSNTGNPVRVVVVFVGVLAVSKSVPELEGSVSTSGDDLSVIKGESDGVDFLGVTLEDSGGLTGSQIPKSEGLVPRGGKAEKIISRKADI